MLGVLLIVMLGWTCGTLINYLADVLPTRHKLTRPFCLHCGEPFPLVEYLGWWRGCPHCHHRRAWRTWVVESTYIIASGWLWVYPPDRLGFVIGLVLLIYFGIVVVIDLEHRLILYSISLAGAVIGAVIGTWLHGWLATLLGGLFGFGLMLLFYFLGTLFGRWMARRRGEALEEEALGFGDVCLSGVLGLLLGWPGIILGLIVAIMLGAIVSLLYLLGMILSRKYRLFAAIPYGPFLVAGTVLLLYFR